MSDITKIPPHVLDAAADWLVLLHSGEMTALQQQQFEQWKTEKKRTPVSTPANGKIEPRFIKPCR